MKFGSPSQILSLTVVDFFLFAAAELRYLPLQSFVIWRWTVSFAESIIGAQVRTSRNAN